MKKLLLFLLSIILCSCTSIDKSDDNNVYWEDDILWIGLTYADNEQAKEDVRTALKGDFDLILKMAKHEKREMDIKEIPIATAYFDLNHDGRDDIIAFISNIELHGVRANGALYVIADTEDGLMGKAIAGFPLIRETLDDPMSKQIGIIDAGNEWVNLVVDSPDLVVRRGQWSTKINY